MITSFDHRKEENSGASSLLTVDVENASYSAVPSKDTYAAIQSQDPPTTPEKVFSLTTLILMYTTWASMAVFAAYIFFAYLSSFVTGKGGAWDLAFPGLDKMPISKAGMTTHFLGGSTLLVLGFVQLLPFVRHGYPHVHRWTGRVFVLASIFTALGGLTFIALHGTVGGIVMDVGFGIYGLLMIWMAVEAWRHARARRFEEHRAWAMRLLSLTIASWLFRVEYGMAYAALGLNVHALNYTSFFDRVMDFGFYVPNLILVECLLRWRARPQKITAGANIVASVIFAGISMFPLYYAFSAWVPIIIASLLGTKIRVPQ